MDIPKEIPAMRLLFNSLRCDQGILEVIKGISPEIFVKIPSKLQGKILKIFGEIPEGLIEEKLDDMQILEGHLIQNYWRNT